MATYRDGYGNRPYGAIELKMTYQRNMLVANAITMTLIASVLISTGALTGGEEYVRIDPLPVPPLDSTIFTIPLGSDILIIPSGGGPRPVPSEMQGWNLVPVEDSLIIDDSALVAVRGSGIDGDPSDTGTVDLGYNPLPGGEPIDDFPEYGVFVWTEKPPVMIDEAKPEYPSVARRLALEGEVIVAALVGGDGKVREARVVRSSGSDALDAAAVDAAYRNVFSPGIQNGRAIAVWVTYTVAFKLAE